MLATGKPVIVFLFNGRPLSINYLAENVPVIFECWYLGQECGRAVADVLFGDCNPGGKLPISIPAFRRPSAGLLQLQTVRAARVLLGRRFAALFPFGFGLSYTTFDLRKPPAGEEEYRAAKVRRACWWM